MLDYRIDTFLALCDRMNYRATAEALRMTQPAVTQHIQYLEQVYGCKLFAYNGRKLSKTDAGQRLEAYARSAEYNELALRRTLNEPRRRTLRIGATKTIGNYVIGPEIGALIQRPDIDLSLIVDNTRRLLELLNQGALDFALIEGFFDKEAYGWQLYQEAPFVGICAPGHPFAGKVVSIEDLRQELLLLREPGSGTRAIFEELLQEYGENLSRFSRTACIGSFSLIKELAAAGQGVSFAYEAVLRAQDRLAQFSLSHQPVTRRFHFVYLKDTSAPDLVQLFLNPGLPH